MALIMLAELLSAKSEASQLSPGVYTERGEPEAGLITGWGSYAAREGGEEGGRDQGGEADELKIEG